MSYRRSIKKSILKVLAYTVLFAIILLPTLSVFTTPIHIASYSLILGILYERLDRAIELIKDR